MGTLILNNPHNVLAGFALSLVDSTIAIYTSVVQNRNSPRMTKNLRWLIHLRSKVGNRMAQSPESLHSHNEREEVDENMELLGWKTRLIQRAGQGLQSAQTIQTASKRLEPGLDHPASQTLFNPGLASQSVFDFGHEATPFDNNTSGLDISTEALLTQFWDPAILQFGTTDASDLAVSTWCFIIGANGPRV